MAPEETQERTQRLTPKGTNDGHCPHSHPFTDADAYPHPDAPDQAVIMAALFAAMCCAVVSALAGNLTAWLLLASAALCLGLGAAGVQFHFVFWLMIDATVILLIIRPEMTAADCVILALFIPAWVFYILPDPHRYNGTALVVIAQLLLSVEPRKIASAPRRYREWWQNRPNFNEMVAHARIAGA